MNLSEYQNLSERTMPEDEPIYRVAANYAMGLTGESGEVTDILKKHLFHGHELDKQGLKKELGDVLHYLSGLATLHGIELEDVAQGNIDKLQKRFPNGFNSEDSIKRRDTE